MELFTLKGKPGIFLEDIMAIDKVCRNLQHMKIQHTQHSESYKWSQAEFLDVSGTIAQRSLYGVVNKKYLTSGKSSLQVPYISE